MIGASGPKPEIPSCTIVPEVTATSTTFGPQALLTVPMSIPWSIVQWLGVSTRDVGVSGNTQPPAVSAGTPTAGAGSAVVVLRTIVSSIAAVLRPTAPLTGRRL